jgi:hypothetical protein
VKGGAAPNKPHFRILGHLADRRNPLSAGKTLNPRIVISSCQQTGQILQLAYL